MARGERLFFALHADGFLTDPCDATEPSTLAVRPVGVRQRSRPCAATRCGAGGRRRRMAADRGPAAAAVTTFVMVVCGVVAAEVGGGRRGGRSRRRGHRSRQLPIPAGRPFRTVRPRSPPTPNPAAGGRVARAVRRGGGPVLPVARAGRPLRPGPAPRSPDARSRPGWRHPARVPPGCRARRSRSMTTG